MHDLSSILIVAAIAFLLAGFVKGVIGMGLPPVAIGLLSTVLTPAEAAAILVVPTIVTNVWQFASGVNLRPLLRRLWPLLASSAIATFLCTGLLARAGHQAAIALGFALGAYAILGLAKVQFSVPARMQSWLSPLVGTSTGIVAGATGMMSLPAIAYFQAIGLDKEDMIQALGLLFTTSMLALGGGLLREGVLQGSMAAMSMLALAPSAGGMLLGQWLRLRIQPEAFRVFFYLGLLGLGTDLVLRAVS
jgi:uncharacterized protein